MEVFWILAVLVLHAFLKVVQTVDRVSDDALGVKEEISFRVAPAILTTDSFLAEESVAFDTFSETPQASDEPSDPEILAERDAVICDEAAAEVLVEISSVPSDCDSLTDDDIPLRVRDHYSVYNDS